MRTIITLSILAMISVVPAAEQEQKLIEVLKSNAGLKEKCDACRQLARIGTKACVPVLESLLTDEKLAHMARYGLEPNRTPEAAKALRGALGKLKGTDLVGLISTLGLRKDHEAVEPLIGLLGNEDAAVAMQAARALGRIATPACGKALQGQLPGASDKKLAVLCESLLTCAKNFVAAGRKAEAVAICDALRAHSKASVQVRAGGLRGAIIARGKDGLELLTEAIRGKDETMAQTALRTALELKDPGVAKLLAEELPKAPVGRQVLIAGILGKLADAVARPALIDLAETGQQPARSAGLRAIAEIGGLDAVGPLAALMKDSDRQVAATASDCLAGLSGNGVDEAVLSILDKAEQDLKVTLVGVVVNRRILAAKPALEKLMKDKEGGLRVAAISAYGEFAETKDLPKLLDGISTSTDRKDFDAYFKAIGSVCTMAPDPGACAEPVAAAMGKASAEVKPTLLKILKVCGGPAALKAVRRAVDDDNKDVHTAAIRTISEWKTVDAVPVLLELAQNSKQDVDRILTLRGYLGMAMKKGTKPEDKLEICRQAAPLIKRDDQKRLLLGTLASLPVPASITLAAPYLDDTAVKSDAAITILAIVKRGGKKVHTPEAKAALKKIADSIPKQAKQANDLLKKMK